MDAMQNTYSVSYDFLGRRTRLANPDGSYRTTTYDDVNNVVYVYDELNRRTSYQYDWAGRLIKLGEWNPAAAVGDWWAPSSLVDKIDAAMTGLGFIPGLDVISDAYFLGRAIVDVVQERGWSEEVAMNVVGIA